MAALGGQSADSIEGLRQLDRETARRLASRHLEKLRAFSPTALRIVDKMPDNYFSLGLLASLFPRAKFIHCRRDLRDVAVSCWMTHFREIRWANDQQHIASRFHEYQRMMEHWRKVLPVPVLEVDYEETVADLEGVARKLVAWCGLEWEPFDAFGFGESIALYPDQVKKYLETGSYLAWGLVPTSEKIIGQTVDSLVKHFDGLLENLAGKGIGRDLVQSQSIITPSCGTGSLGQELAEKVFDLLGKTSSKLASRV